MARSSELHQHPGRRIVWSSLIALVAVSIVFCGCAARKNSNCNESAVSSTGYVTHVSLFDLAGAPDKYVGKTVQVHGYLTVGFEANFLSPTATDEGFVRHGDSVWVNLRRVVDLDDDVRAAGDGFGTVLVEGVVSADRTMGARCTIDNACILYVLPNRLLTPEDDEVFQHTEKLFGEDLSEKDVARRWLVANKGQDFPNNDGEWLDWWGFNRLPELSRKCYDKLESFYFPAEFESDR